MSDVPPTLSTQTAAQASPQGTSPSALRDFGLIVVGDEILSGRRQDKHLPKVIELLGERGLRLAHAHVVGDDPARLEALLRESFASGDVVFCCGGIGATPDDHTRQCAARALGVPLALHPQARDLIVQRMRDVAVEQGTVFDPDRPDNVHRLNMGVFPQGCEIIPNPYNRIPGFSIREHYFVPGFPVMAWPMLAWVLDTHYSLLFHSHRWVERSVVVFDAMEATLTPVMETLEREHPGIRVFSLPSVDHPQHGRHIELGVKGPQGADGAVDRAFAALKAAVLTVTPLPRLGPEMVR